MTHSKSVESLFPIPVKVPLSQWPQMDGKLLPTKLPTLLVSSSKVLSWVWELISHSTFSKPWTPSDVLSWLEEQAPGCSLLPSGISLSNSNSKTKSLSMLMNTIHTFAPAKKKPTLSLNSWKLLPLLSPSCLDAHQMPKSQLLLNKLPRHEHD